MPGRPDIVLNGGRVVFVHGCFWHQHSGCRFAQRPKTRLAYWRTKFEKNRKRDARVQRRLRRLGYRVLVIWECQTRNPCALRAKLLRFLQGTNVSVDDKRGLESASHATGGHR